jgi:hypothetical protein
MNLFNNLGTNCNLSRQCLPENSIFVSNSIGREAQKKKKKKAERPKTVYRLGVSSVYLFFSYANLLGNKHQENLQVKL